MQAATSSPAGSTAGLDSKVTATPGLTSALIDGEVDVPADKDRRDKDVLAAADAGMTAFTTTRSGDTPVFTNVQESFGGASHKPATHVPVNQANVAKPDNQGMKYTFNTWGAGTNYVEVSGTAKTGYRAKASSSEVASILESQLPVDGGISLRIEAPDADPDQALAVLGSTDSEKKDQAEE